MGVHASSECAQGGRWLGGPSKTICQGQASIRLVPSLALTWNKLLAWVLSWEGQQANSPARLLLQVRGAWGLHPGLLSGEGEP